MIDSIAFVEPSWHYFVGVGVAMVINLMLINNQYLHLYRRWMYLVLPLVFGAIVYFALGVILGSGLI